MKIISSHELGKLGEEYALSYLKKKKYKIIIKGFRLFKGEIDIIAYDGDTLVFIEVKTRRDHKYGFPEESVTISKQKQIKKIALGFLTFNNLEEAECRFDVLALILNQNRKFKITHFVDTF